ncbi:MAG: hypothetical protein DMG65_10350 [Candidatus Angelobacter sp. Gp1-AA117]|nr:MAG: hypothetical protein DMG65_10350 [Candidatus Angelobacter sp. Gp1-AA117]
MSISLPQSVFLIAFLFVTLSASAQSKAVSFDFFPPESNMGRTNLIHDETRTARPKLLKRGKRFYQVIINKRTGRELFRVLVGTDEATWWVYGLVQEADINGDGIPDFCWHGGDDTSDLNLLVLSSPSGYRKVDVDQSFRNEWKRRFPSERLDNIEGADEVDSSEIKLIRTSGKVKLQAVVTSTFYDQKIDDIRRYVHTIRVPESRFVYVK